MVSNENFEGYGSCLGLFMLRNCPAIACIFLSLGLFEDSLSNFSVAFVWIFLIFGLFNGAVSNIYNLASKCGKILNCKG
jgi:hypothetical protein